MYLLEEPNYYIGFLAASSALAAAAALLFALLSTYKFWMFDSETKERSE
jgi:hypothetical protein